MKHNPYNKVIGSLSVPKDLANRQTEMVLLYSVASHKVLGTFIAVFGVGNITI